MDFRLAIKCNENLKDQISEGNLLTNFEIDSKVKNDLGDSLRRQ